MSTRRLPNLPPWTAPCIALILLIAFTIVFELFTKGHSDFIKPENLFNIARQLSFIGIIAIGMTFVIILGGIDLSVGSLVAFVGGVGVLTLNWLMRDDSFISGNETLAVLVSFIIMILLGTLAGLLNGVLIAKGRLAPFIATLGGLAAYRSLAQALADGGEYRSASMELFGRIGQGGIAIPGTDIAPAAHVVVPLLIPWPLLIFALVTIVGFIVLNMTRFGRSVYAIGSNETAAKYSAINVGRVKMITYTILGFTCGIAGLLVASRLNSVSSAGTGLLYELDVIAAVVIGGTRMRGGAGTILGTVIGVLILGVISNMLNLLQVSPYLQGLVKGSIIIIAVLAQRSERD